MNLQSLPAIFERVIAGDLTHIGEFALHYHAARRAGVVFPAAMVSPRAAERVLLAWRDGKVGDREARLWGSLIRWKRPASWGEVSPDDLNVGSLDIEFEGDTEDLLLETAARLDELGDVVDGEISPEELEAMLAALRAHRGAP